MIALFFNPWFSFIVQKVVFSVKDCFTNFGFNCHDGVVTKLKIVKALNRSIVYNIEHFISKEKSFIVYKNVKKKDNVPSRLLPIRRWPHGNSCTWSDDIENRTSCVQVCMSYHEATVGLVLTGRAHCLSFRQYLCYI